MALSFALAKEGLTDGTLETTAKVKLDKEGDGFKVTVSEEDTADLAAATQQGRTGKVVAISRGTGVERTSP